MADLKAEATGPAERLAKIAARVGMTPAPRSRELFELADLMSALLRAIELGLFATGSRGRAALPATSAPTQALLRDMNRIIDLWQSATGDRVKDRPAGQPANRVRLPSPTGAPAATPPAGADARRARTGACRAERQRLGARHAVAFLEDPSRQSSRGLTRDGGSGSRPRCRSGGCAPSTSRRRRHVRARHRTADRPPAGGHGGAQHLRRRGRPPVSLYVAPARQRHRPVRPDEAVANTTVVAATSRIPGAGWRRPTSR